jgi:hypothetical protein
MKEKPEEPLPSLAELEAEALAYAQQVGREYLQEKLQRLAQKHGEVFPPKRPKAVAPAAAKPAIAHRLRQG